VQPKSIACLMQQAPQLKLRASILRTNRTHYARSLSRRSRVCHEPNLGIATSYVSDSLQFALRSDPPQMQLSASGPPQPPRPAARGSQRALLALRRTAARTPSRQFA
jgi:hypothetical protein